MFASPDATAEIRRSRPLFRYLRDQTAAGLERDLRRCLAAWEGNRGVDDFPLG